MNEHSELTLPDFITGVLAALIFLIILSLVANSDDEEMSLQYSQEIAEAQQKTIVHERNENLHEKCINNGECEK